jgi:two-component system CheB/CheR fusion protein
MKENELYIVGIGASAGGLEALEDFFKNTPKDTNMAFVVIQHLSPDYKSLMLELLSRHTDLQIYRVEDGMEIKPNSIYLIPPKKNMTVFHNKLFLVQKQNDHILNLPIDIFFKSLAEDQGEKAIGIILSGTGSDGTRGIKAIKEVGGMVIAQEEKTAKFDGMPKSAIMTGLVDYILSPDLMPEQLVKYVQHPFLKDEIAKDGIRNIEKDKMTKIFALLRNYSGVDFTFYKPTTIYRRIERRVGVKQLNNFSEYLELLYSDPQEIKILYKDLLIGVTRFFRDQEVFEEIENKVIPEIFDHNKEEKSIRVWITACSTGEEAYSTAILFREYMEKMKIKYDIKVFATDIDKDAIEKASVGMYPESIVADVSNERLKKYFTKEGNFYYVNREIREMMIFASHNILKDPPFYRMDFISCRNMLIYFQNILQKKVLSLLHFSLNKNGFLVLGSSETTGEMSEYFIPFDNKLKLYKTNSNLKSDLSSNIKLNEIMNNNNKTKSKLINTNFDSIDSNKTLDEIYQRLVNNYMNPTIVLNENNEVILICGGANKYLKFSSGVVSYNISKLIHEDLSTPVITAIHKVQKEKNSLVYSNIKANFGEKIEIVNVFVGYEKLEKNKNNYIIIKIENVEEKSNRFIIEEKQNLDTLTRQRIKDLEQDLQHTKENLQATIEELETSNEELQATNEELLSSNEELQSTNEELQSVNEELITVNTEYQSKIQELQDLNNDMENLLKSTEIGTIFLDNDLCIRKFTPKIKKIINLIDTDIGRPIIHISNNIIGGNIIADAKEVLEKGAPIEKEVKNSDGKNLLKRIMPYKNHNNKIKGVVITFIDITELKKANAEIEKLYLAIEQSQNYFVLTDINANIKFMNKSLLEKLDYNFEELIDKNPSFLKTSYTSEEAYKNLWKNLLKGEKWEGEFCNKTKNGKTYWEKAVITPIKDEFGNNVGYFKVSEDITEKKSIDNARKNEQHLLFKIMDSSFYSVLVIDKEGKFIYFNKNAESVLEIKKDEKGIIMYDDDAWETLDENKNKFEDKEMPYKRVINKGKNIENEIIHVKFKSGKIKKLRLDATPFFDEQGKISGATFNFIEIKN